MSARDALPQLQKKKRTTKKAAPPAPVVFIPAYEPYELVPTAQYALPLPFESEGLMVCDALDSMTLACEAGLLMFDGWVRQCFATRADFDQFIEELGEYDDCYRINDRWWKALAHLGDSPDQEEGFIRTIDIAEGLLTQAAVSGQLAAFTD